jgi:hypothetical protein
MCAVARAPFAVSAIGCCKLVSGVNLKSGCHPVIYNCNLQLQLTIIMCAVIAVVAAAAAISYCKIDIKGSILKSGCQPVIYKSVS